MLLMVLRLKWFKSVLSYKVEGSRSMAPKMDDSKHALVPS